jgi:hypothetical protein
MMVADPHPDVGRKAALKSLYSRISAAQRAIANLEAACSSPSLSRQSTVPYDGLDSLSFDKLCVRLDNRAADLQQALEGMRRSIAKLGKMRNASNAIVPVHRLPNEILRRIFIEVFYLDHHGYGTPSRHKIRMVTSVCCLWRDVCNCIHIFWKDMQLGIDTTVPQARIYLERTRGSFLDISLDFFSKRLGTSALQVIAPSICTWSRLRLHGPDNRIREAILTLTHSKNPKAMKGLTICGDEEDWIKESSFHGQDRLFWESFPDLTSVEIKGASFPWSLPILRNLTRLVLRHVPCPSVDVFKLVMHNSPGLEELTLENFRQNEEENADTIVEEVVLSPQVHPLEYTCMRSVSLSDVPAHILHTFLSTSTAPALQSLTCDVPVNVVLFDMTEFLERSSAESLNSLTVRGWRDENAEDPHQESSMVPVLSHCRNLTSLKFIDTSLNQQTLLWLAPPTPQNSECLCPKLQELLLDRVHCPMLTLVRIIQIRHAAEDIPTLESVIIDDCTPLGHELDMTYSNFLNIKGLAADAVVRLHCWEWLFMEPLVD